MSEWPNDETAVEALCGQTLTRLGCDAEEHATVQLFLPSLRAWCAASIASAEIEDAGRVPREVLDGARALGLFGVSVPERFGGAGHSMTAAGQIVAEIARHDASVAVCLGLHAGLALRALVHLADEPTRARWLPPMASGEAIGAFAATEPSAGSHIAAVQTRAAAREDGTLVLDGQKIYVTNGGLAQTFTVLARTPGLDGHRNGWSLLLVDRADPGVTVGPEEHKLGLRGSSTTPLYFENVTLSRDRLIGPPAGGLEAFGDVLAWGRSLMAFGCVGMARSALDRAVRHARDRSQFGRPLTAFGQVSESLARMRLRVFAMESLARAVGAYNATGLDIEQLSTAAKLFNSESAWLVADAALQCHGGAGYIEETGIARVLRDARITRIFEGANEVLRFRLGCGFIERSARDGVLAPPLRDALLAPAAASAASLALEIRSACEALRREHGLRLYREQLASAALGDVAALWVALWATLARIDGELTAAEADGRSAWVRLATFATQEFGRDLRGLLDRARGADEPLAQAIAADVLNQALDSERGSPSPPRRLASAGRQSSTTSRG